MLVIKKVLLYGQIPYENINDTLAEIREYIRMREWQLIEAIIDYTESLEGLFSIPSKLEGIDIILYHDKNNNLDDFVTDFLYQIAKAERIEIIRY